MEKFYFCYARRNYWKKKKKECKFSEHFEIQPSSDFVHQTIEWFICTCYSKIHPRISEKFFLASFRVNDPLWRWFLFESKNKRDKGGGRGKGKNWHPLCTHPQLAFGQVNFKLKGASRRSTAFNAFDSIYFTINDFRISSLWVFVRIRFIGRGPLMAWLKSWKSMSGFISKL